MVEKVLFKDYVRSTVDIKAILLKHIDNIHILKKIIEHEDSLSLKSMAHDRLHVLEERAKEVSASNTR